MAKSPNKSLVFKAREAKLTAWNGSRLDLGQKKRRKYVALNQLCSASPCSQINDGEPKALEHVCGLTLPLAYDHGSVNESLFERA